MKKVTMWTSDRTSLANAVKLIELAIDFLDVDETLPSIEEEIYKLREIASRLNYIDMNATSLQVPPGTELS